MDARQATIITAAAEEEEEVEGNKLLLRCRWPARIYRIHHHRAGQGMLVQLLRPLQRHQQYRLQNRKLGLLRQERQQHLRRPRPRHLSTRHSNTPSLKAIRRGHFSINLISTPDQIPLMDS